MNPLKVVHVKKDKDESKILASILMRKWKISFNQEKKEEGISWRMGRNGRFEIM
jgi:hypothetical protein